MTTNDLRNFRTRNTATPQTEKAAKGQKRNNAGGYSFTVSDLEQAKRFLILGSSSNYYTPGAELTKENAKVIIKLAESEHSRDLVDLIVQISTEGRAAKQQPGLFALALAASHGTAEARGYALSKLPAVARTASTLAEFVSFALQFRGWGSAMPRAVANWYITKPVNDLAYQIAKYGNRAGWSQGDLLRVSHPNFGVESWENTETGVTEVNPEVVKANALADYAIRGTVDESLPRIILGVEEAKKAKVSEVPALVKEYGLSWEMVPNDKRDADVWRALLQSGMPLGALIRQLPTLTRQGILTPLSAEEKLVVSALTDETALHRARIHPLNVLLALRTYSAGRSYRGTSSWTPNKTIVNALDKAFVLSFKNVEPTEKRFLIGLDVSGSMGATVNDSFLTSRDVAAAFSTIFSKTEPYTHTIGFTGGKGSRSSYGWGYGANTNFENVGTGKYGSVVTDLSDYANKDLNTLIARTDTLPFGATDCALPMLYALEQGIEADVFMVVTDNETWAGDIHPHEALKRYRAKTGIDAKLIVLATTASRYSIADKDDAGMLDIAGFDSAVPQVVSEFIKGF